MNHNLIFNMRDMGIALYELAFRFLPGLFAADRHSRDGSGKSVIVLVDGRRLPFGFLRGKARYGLTDQLRNILSVYSFCKKRDLDFKVNWTFPFPLSDYLIPNLYDWSIPPGMVSLDFFTTKFCSFQAGDTSVTPTTSTGDRHIRKLEQSVRRLKDGSQLLCTEMPISRSWISPACSMNSSNRPQGWPKRFCSIREGLADHTKCTLRFQNRLGDFEEADVVPLSHSEAENLMSRCGDRIEELWRSGSFSTDKILVTSDSNRFLEYVTKRFEFVYAVTGERKHSAFNESGAEDVWRRSFVDLLMLAGSERITLLVTDAMYESGFPYFAALVGQFRSTLKSGSLKWNTR